MDGSAEVIRLDAGPETVHWGYFDSRLSPVATIESGDRIVISTVSGGPELLPPAPFEVPPALPEIHAAHGPQRFFGHICTGPVAVRGARAGQTLQVDIERIEPHYDWGHNVIRPLAGALPADFADARVVHTKLDRERRIWRLPWGHRIPFRPFFGVMAVAPPPAWGVIPTPPPRANGGNVDNKELVEGTTLYLPIFVDGALFSVGDGHGAQGDGEVCLTAIETGLIGRFRLSVRDDIALEWPRAETPTHVITMGFDPDLDNCVVIALRQMLDLVCDRTAIDRHQAYTLLSVAGDLRVTQVVNGNKGVHLMLDKRYLDPFEPDVQD
ncbi:acetamidase/formamidase family protein [Acidisphaera rubrifaciens]|uniref:Acetamidase/formamidase n=1 Tax=Acidisphaera rubrifaciens HS-AP3 TaxID=1231350 RepID=A0A0D6PA89_9PROT|nr:acetamidase/formamidase family protein [Acidisphaera rubrifaciens]GAN77784.1 acetamidase/formamidase [Acidisphaera rubrifaciens HS-AP3]